MITVGVRNLKAQLSYYLRLMMEGEEIAICMRDKVVGYLSNAQRELKKKAAKRRSKRDLQKLMDEWKRDGFIISGGKVGVRWGPHKPAKMTPGISASEIIRKMRDEEL